MTIYRCAIKFEMGNHEAVNVLHMADSDNQEAAIAGDFSAEALTEYLALMPAAAEAVSVVVTNLTAMTQATVSLVGTGTAGGEGCPPQAAAVISWRTPIVGRRYRGRTYVPYISEAIQTNGILTVAGQTALSLLATAIRETWAGGHVGRSLVLYHRDTNASTWIQSFIARDILYTQRRRTVGVGS